MDTRRLPKDYNEIILYFLLLKFLLIWIKLDRHFNISRCWQNCSASYVFLLLFVFHSYFFGKQAEVKTTPFSHLNPLNLIYFFFLINVWGIGTPVWMVKPQIKDTKAFPPIWKFKLCCNLLEFKASNHLY